MPVVSLVEYFILEWRTCFHLQLKASPSPIKLRIIFSIEPRKAGLQGCSKLPQPVGGAMELYHVKLFIYFIIYLFLHSTE